MEKLCPFNCRVHYDLCGNRRFPINMNILLLRNLNQSCTFTGHSFTAMKGLIIFFLACGCSTMQIKSVDSASDECSLTPVIHVLQFPGCVPKPIPSFACIGKCGSYVQVSGWSGFLMKLTQIEIFRLSPRSPEARSGKWSARATAARNQAKGRPQCPSSAPKPSKARENSERFDSLFRIFLLPPRFSRHSPCRQTKITN